MFTQLNIRIIVITIILAVTLSGCTHNRITGPRIPTTYFATTGVGQSDDGIPPDPYETFSYDLALKEAGIENFNVVYYTSVLPQEAKEVPLEAVRDQFHHGAVLETIMAKAEGAKGDTLVAGVGRIWAKDASGIAIGGFAAEYERVYKGREVTKEEAKADAIQQLSKSLKHELSIRDLSQSDEMTFDTTSLYVTKKYGIALAALGFINFIYPKATPIE